MGREHSYTLKIGTALGDRSCHPMELSRACRAPAFVPLPTQACT